ncbi:MAG: EamA family transporter [Solirubrobacterales bacterium]|nr:MAG: EamA family transporter [Solirubrobacterales bacterium]
MSSTTATIAPARLRGDRGQIAVALAAVAWSTAGVLQRQLSVGIATQVAGRALFASLAVATYVAVAERGRVIQACRSVGGAGIGFAACLAVSSGAFIVALNHATVAQVLFIQAIAPVVAALLGRRVLNEALSVRTVVAMVVALLGVGVMIGSPGGGSALGDGLSVLMALGFAVAIVIARHRRDVSMAPATGLAQLMLLVIGAPVAFAGGGGLGFANVLWLALFGAGQIGVGLILLTIGARLIPAAQVALISLLEVVLGPFWVWLAVGERPGLATVIGGAIVVAAVVLQAREPARRDAPAPVAAVEAEHPPR